MRQNQSDVKRPAAGLRRGRRIRGASEAWRTDLGLVYRGDATAILPRIEADSVALAFADPPFNLGKVYGADGMPADDLREEKDYLEWCRAWVDQLVRVLMPGGSLFLYNLPRWNAHLAAHLDGALTFRHSIAVDMKYSLPLRGRLYPAHYSLLYMTKGKPRVFAPPRTPMTTCPACGKEVKDYGGYKSKLNPAGFNLSDVWSDLSPVRHPRYKSRAGNQLPLKMLDRILDIATNPGDLVLDPFAGSGTTLVAAELKGRRWLGIEIVELDPILSRLRDLGPEGENFDRISESKNRLFTARAEELRRLHRHEWATPKVSKEGGT